ncbi:MAG: rhodanese-like domain-containing protein [Opitutae bacterium]|nr:rhodanese-like domain-containing protein [Opitutae bacterium]
MKRLLFALSLFVSAAFAADVAKITPADVAKIAPADAAKLVAEGKAVLVDVREANEWAETGVAAPAVLLAKSEFDAGRTGEWKHFLASVGDKEIILACRSGHRAGIVAAALAAEGCKVANAGGFKDWQAASLPVRKADAPAPAK